MNYLTKEQILTPANLKTEEVEVPELGGSVRIMELTAGRRELWEPELTNPTSYRVRAALVAFSVVDENGDLIFNADDIEALTRQSFEAIDRIYTACVKLNAGIKHEELEKN